LGEAEVDCRAKSPAAAPEMVRPPRGGVAGARASEGVGGVDVEREQVRAHVPLGVPGLRATATPLRVGPTSVDQTAGEPASAAVTSPGGCALDFALGDVPFAAEADPLGLSIVLSGTVLRARVTGPDRLCGEFDGRVEALAFDLNEAGDACVLLRASPDGAIAPPQRGEFACP
jgi:hypothetical protein